MACRLFGAKPLPEPMLVYCQLASWMFQWNLNRNFIIFTEENAFENIVYQYGGHFVQGIWVKIRIWILYFITLPWPNSNGGLVLERRWCLGLDKLLLATSSIILPSFWGAFESSFKLKPLWWSQRKKPIGYLTTRGINWPISFAHWLIHGVLRDNSKVPPTCYLGEFQQSILLKCRGMI